MFCYVLPFSWSKTACVRFCSNPDLGPFEKVSVTEPTAAQLTAKYTPLPRLDSVCLSSWLQLLYLGDTLLTAILKCVEPNPLGLFSFSDKPFREVHCFLRFQSLS